MFFHRIATRPRKGRRVRRTAPQRGYVLPLNGGDDAGEAEEFLRVLRFAVDQHLIMDMRAGSAPGAAEKADLAMPGDTLSDRHSLAVQMGVAGRDAVAVVDLDDLAVIVTTSGIGHDAGRGRVDRGHVRRPQIDTGAIGRTGIVRTA